MKTPDFHKQQLRHEWERIINNYSAENPILSTSVLDGTGVYLLDIGDLGYIYYNDREAHEDYQLLCNSLLTINQ